MWLLLKWADERLPGQVCFNYFFFIMALHEFQEGGSSSIARKGSKDGKGKPRGSQQRRNSVKNKEKKRQVRRLCVLLISGSAEVKTLFAI